MSEYTPVMTDLTDEQVKKLQAMHIPNNDECTDEDQWVKNCTDRADTDIETTKEAIKIFLK